MLSSNAWVVALVVVAVSCAVIALVAVVMLFVLVGIARRLARLEVEMGTLMQEARRETAATMEAVRGAVDEVHELAGTARRLGTELPLAIALGWLGTRKGTLPAAVAGAISVFKGWSRRPKKRKKKEKEKEKEGQGQQGQPATEPNEGSSG